MLIGVEAGHEVALRLVEKAPKLEWPYHYYAFGELSTERQIGMGAGPIPHSAIRDWAREDKLTTSETDVLHYVIRQVDNHYLSKQAKKLEQQGKSRK